MYRQFLRNNPTIVSGIGLPLLVVILLSAAALGPAMMLAAPGYGAVFAINYYPEGSRSQSENKYLI